MALNTVLLAATFDQTLTSSNNIESITPTGGSPKTVHIPGIGDVYCYVLNAPLYSEGQERFDLNAGSGFAGFKQVTYTQQVMHRDTLAYMKTTYRGQVSVNVTLDGSTYSDWNAYLRFQHDVDDGREWFRNVRYIFTLIEEIA